MNKAAYWLLTIPEEEFVPPGCLLKEMVYVGGQLEEGGTTGYRHWQVIVCFTRQHRLASVKKLFGSKKIHGEPSKSQAARNYCFKKETAVPESQFECGSYPVRANERDDWDAVFGNAQRGINSNLIRTV